MKKILGHNDANFTDAQSISLIENILTTHRKVMPKLDKVDKWPNIDGFVEIQDDQHSFFGKLFVQVKTLPKKHGCKFSCPLSFFSYSEIEPCLLLGVDNDNGKVYWLYFDHQAIQKIDFGKNRYSKTLSFDPLKFFDKTTTVYIEEWRKIVQDNQRKFKNYDEVKEAYEILNKRTNKVSGKESINFKSIHIFLDFLNSILDRELRIVKDRFYPNQWKLGLAYYEYLPSSVSYSLYPIPFNKNDVQIKEIDERLYGQVEMAGLGFSMHIVENPIESRPKNYAKEIIKKKTFKVIENKLLIHTGNQLLAKEFIFAFIDKFSEQLGLEKKDEYPVQDIKQAFYDYLPLWLEESHKLLQETNRNNFRVRMEQGLITHLDPDIISNINEDECSYLEDRIRIRMEEGDKSKNILMGSKQFPFGIFTEFLEDIQDEKIARPYLPKDFSRLKGKSSFIWDNFSKEGAKKNIGIVIENLLEVYDNFIEQNFPYIKEDLSFFHDKSDKVIIHFHLKENYERFEDGPGYTMWHLSSLDGKGGKDIEIITDSEFGRLEKARVERVLMYKGQEYKIITIRSGILDFPYEDTPLLYLIYEILNDRIKEYFEAL